MVPRTVEGRRQVLADERGDGPGWIQHRVYPQRRGIVVNVDAHPVVRHVVEQFFPLSVPATTHDGWHHAPVLLVRARYCLGVCVTFERAADCVDVGMRLRLLEQRRQCGKISDSYSMMFKFPPSIIVCRITVGHPHFCGP